MRLDAEGQLTGWRRTACPGPFRAGGTNRLVGCHLCGCGCESGSGLRFTACVGVSQVRQRLTAFRLSPAAHELAHPHAHAAHGADT